MKLHRLLLAASLAALVFAPAAAAGKPQRAHHVHTGGLFGGLIADLAAPGLPPGAATALRPYVARAMKVALRRPCTAVRDLNAMRGAVPGLDVPAANAASLAADALMAETGLRLLPGTKRCGGSGGHPGRPRVRVLHSSLGGLDLRVVLPVPAFAPRVGDGQPFVDLSMDGYGSGGAVGGPGLPSLTSFFATPPGMTPHVRVVSTTGYLVPAVKLFPHQDQAADATGDNDPFADPPFTIDRKAYASRTPFPATPAAAGDVGKLRDLETGGVQLTGASYVPLTGALRVYRTMRLRVTFTGDGRPTGFGPATIASGWERSARSIYASALVNWPTVAVNLEPKIRAVLCGEELLIVTSHALRAAADTLAAARSAAGFVTRIAEVGSGAGQIGTTATEVRLFIRGELSSNCLWHPSYVAIVGDVSQVPTTLVTTPWATTGFDGMIATDLPYAQADDSDLLPDLAIGRIPANTLDEATAAVAKIVRYEQTPPISSAFYHQATLTSYFQGAGPQDERGFVKTSQTIANALEADGRTVDRVYTVDSASVDPATYYDGTPMPASLQRPAFAWDGTTTDLIDDWNAGRFIVFHRDHGAPNLWANPGFTTGDIPSLANGNLLPVVFAINCASGKFDDPTQSLDEQLMMLPSGGAVGVVGDSRNSPTFTNNHIALGMFDAIFPNVLPAYGSAGRVTRMGDVLVAGKWYMNTQAGVDFQDDPSTRAEQYLYHWFGDPTMPIRLTPPLLYVVRVNAAALSATHLRLQFGAATGTGLRAAAGRPLPNLRGAWVTVFQSGMPVGRARVRGHQTVSLQLDRALDPKAPYQVSLDDAASVPQSLTAPALQP